MDPKDLVLPPAMLEDAYRRIRSLPVRRSVTLLPIVRSDGERVYTMPDRHVARIDAMRTIFRMALVPR